jgi:hypothetical protein
MQLPLVRLSLATVACYLDCLDTVAPAHPSEHWKHLKYVFLSLAVGQIQHLPRRPVGFKKSNKKTIYVPNDDYFVSVGA